MIDRTELVYDYVKSLLGLPYAWGGDNPGKGFDCSGLVVEILASQGIIAHKADYSSQGLFNAFSSKWPTPDLPAFGDLCFYGRSLDAISHVAFCLDSGLMVEAGGGGSRTRTPVDAAVHGAFVRIRPITYRRDLLEFLSPPFRF